MKVVDNLDTGEPVVIGLILRRCVFIYFFAPLLMF